MTGPRRNLALTVVGFVLTMYGCGQRAGRECSANTDCEDDNPCTLDRCDTDGRCTNEPVDQDGDGHGAVCGGGDDCDDHNEGVHPGVDEICADGLDNDCDGSTDCQDPDCAEVPGCGGAEICANGVDDDGDGFIDCSDPDCTTDPACGGDENCSNHEDDDGDGLVDCDDPDCHSDPSCCTAFTERCDDLQDNDCDGLVDCADPHCSASIACGAATCEPAAEIHCEDTVFASTDDPGATGNVVDYSCGGGAHEGPEYTFHLKPGPGGWLPGRPVTISLFMRHSSPDLFVLEGPPVDQATGPCDPGRCVAASVEPDILPDRVTFVPDEGRTYYVVVDNVYLDSGGPFWMMVRCDTACQPEVCDDGQDNDCDGFADCDDPDCGTDPVCCVPSPEDCSDGVDNDCDFIVDCLDPDCQQATACVCRPEICDDGLDNDCDFLADCSDPDCGGASNCGGPVCEVKFERFCGWSGFGDPTAGTVTELVEHYSCGGPLQPGPEDVTVLSNVNGQWGNNPIQVSVRMRPDFENLDLFVLEGNQLNDPQQECDPGHCLVAGTNPGLTEELVTFVAWPDRVYYLVVDTPVSGLSPTYEFQVLCANLCEPEDCTDGWDNDCDGLADCFDPDCASHPGC